MATYREMIYYVLDQVKASSDDAYYTEEHVSFLLSKIRSLLLEQKYSKSNEEIKESNYQTICLDLMEVPAISGEPCEGGTYLRSVEKIPYLSTLSTPKVYPEDFYQGNITYVSRERMRYVGYNKWLQNIIYASLGPDNYLYFKSSNPQFLYLEKVRMTGIFEDPDKAAELECNNDGEDSQCDPLDKEFPLEEDLQATLLDTAVKTLLGATYRPSDFTNDAKDDLSDMMAFIRRNMKSNLQKQIEE